MFDCLISESSKNGRLFLTFSTSGNRESDDGEVKNEKKRCVIPKRIQKMITECKIVVWELLNKLYNKVV